MPDKPEISCRQGYGAPPIPVYNPNVSTPTLQMCVEGETQPPAQDVRVVSFRGQMFGLRIYARSAREVSSFKDPSTKGPTLGTCLLVAFHLARIARILAPAFTGFPIGFARHLAAGGGL